MHTKTQQWKQILYPSLQLITPYDIYILTKCYGLYSMDILLCCPGALSSRASLCVGSGGRGELKRTASSQLAYKWLLYDTLYIGCSSLVCLCIYMQSVYIKFLSLDFCVQVCSTIQFDIVLIFHALYKLNFSPSANRIYFF